MDSVPTPSQTVGPFFSLATDQHCVRCIAGPQAKGERVWLVCRVFDAEGQPVPGALIEVWQADSEGRYPSLGVDADPECRGFGRMVTGEDGGCEFETIIPGCVPGPGNTRQAPHLSVAIFARGLLKQLFTRIYFAGHPANQEDPVLALVPEDRRHTLMANGDPARPTHHRFEIRLQGEQETVFFDV
jgi:protocatechuate 3,4-dioxygenase alpha subunit